MRVWLKSLVLVLLSVSTVHATVFIGRFGARGTDAFLPDSWSPHVRALYLLNNSSGDTADSSGHAWTLTNTNTVTSDTTNYREPFYATEGRAASFAAASNEYYTCADGTCGGTAGLDIDGSNLTDGCWLRPTTSTVEMIALQKTPGTNGYEMSLQSTNVLRCRMGSTVAAENTDTTGTIADNAFGHAACVGTGTSYLAYLNGELDATNTPGTYRQPADNSSAFNISTSTAANDWNGQIDECFVDDIAWGAQSICRACAIGIGGDDDASFFTESRGECDPTLTYNYKSCATNSDCNSPFGVCADANSEDNCAGARCCMGYRALYCGDCDLPDCDAAGPEENTPVYPTDWTSSLRAVWRFEDSPGLVNDSTGVTGNFTNNGAAVNQSTQFREGTEALQMAQGSNQYFSCSDATCGGTTKADFDGSTSATWGCWGRYTADPTPTNTFKYFLNKSIAGNAGWLYRLGVSSGGYRRPNCSWGNGTTTVGIQAPAGRAVPLSTWHHGICTANGTTGILYKDGIQRASTATAIRPGNSTGVLYINNATAAQDYSGEVDECVIDDIAWGPQTVCRVCSLGVDGELGECDANSPTLYKTCSTNADCNADGSGVCDTGSGRCEGYRTTRCGSCTLPSCNTSTPTTS